MIWIGANQTERAEEVIHVDFHGVLVKVCAVTIAIEIIVLKFSSLAFYFDGMLSY